MDPLEASRLVTDEYSAKILVATFRKAKSAIDLSREYGIPIAACYRRIHGLERAGLIRCTERALTQKGKRISSTCPNSRTPTSSSRTAGFACDSSSRRASR